MSPHLRKKLLIITSLTVIVIAAALIILAGLSNRIIKHRLERSLGGNFSVEGISLGWSGVELIGPRFLRDGRTAAYAKRIVLRADLLTLVRPGFSLSRLVIEEPAVLLEIDRSGEWVAPIVIENRQEPAPTPAAGPLFTGLIIVRDGALTIRDRRLRGPNVIEIRGINVRMEDVAFPVRNRPSRFKLRMGLAGALISGIVTGGGTINWFTMGTDIAVEARDLTLLDPGGAAGPVFRAPDLRFTATSEGLPEKPLLLSDLAVTGPQLLLESDRNGVLLRPFRRLTSVWAGGGKGSGVRIAARNLRITGGDILFLDGGIAERPYPVRFTGIEFEADAFSLPSGNRNTAYRLRARLPGNLGTGELVSSGIMNLKTLDTNARVTLRDIDLTGLKPYLARQGGKEVSRGFVDLSMDVGIRKKLIDAPARAVIRDLEFSAGRGLTAQFLGIPRVLLVTALESHNRRIGFDFTLEGSLENPEFNIRGSLVRLFTIGLAQSLGLSVVEAGERVIVQGGRGIQDLGRKGIKGIGKGIRESGKKLQGLFK